MLVTIAAQSSGALADNYPDSFADYLNAHDLYFDFVDAAARSLWVEAPSGDIRLGIPGGIAPEVSVTSAETPPEDGELTAVRADLYEAISQVLQRLSIKQCSVNSANSEGPCVPAILHIGFASRHGDVIYLPDLRDAVGNQISGMPGAAGYFQSHERAYAMSCGSYIGRQRSGNVTLVEAGLTLESFPLHSLQSEPTESLSLGFERCILHLLGVSVLPNVPAGDLDYYIARSLETLHKAEAFLTHDQTADDIPELVMMHAIKKALGKDPTVGEQ
ncbi:MAG TPA: hypothetical protein VMT54_22775 [Candidatus Cybelea sp.]|nr:hypothetical protein [Candidatus Cybelea sp.]